jgi:hypothetical protein
MAHGAARDLGSHGLWRVVQQHVSSRREMAVGGALPATVIEQSDELQVRAVRRRHR